MSQQARRYEATGSPAAQKAKLFSLRRQAEEIDELDRVEDARAELEFARSDFLNSGEAPGSPRYRELDAAYWAAWRTYEALRR